MSDPPEPATPREATYHDDVAALTPDRLRGGFFEGWPNPPTPDGHLRHLRGCEYVLYAVHPASGDVVGFCSAIGDGGTVAFISLLEVLPGWRGQGIGTGLMRRMLDHYRDRYAIDLVADDDVAPFYERLGGTRGRAMLWRNRT
ncbi:MAG TPA: GNAT family N-acetyltransferase [Candidatus Limnocylindrales bacterium]|nr:GNAT family N-acetyltransferase [Candidatus Limnocylindrales bacterium]